MRQENTLQHRWFQQVWNEGRENMIDELIAPEAIAHGLSGDAPMKGPEGFKEFYNTFRSTFSDVHVEVQQVVAQDDYECALCSVTARHTKSGRNVSFGGMCMTRIRDGKIVEGWNFFDFLGMHQQLGNELQVNNY